MSNPTHTHELQPTERIPVAHLDRDREQSIHVLDGVVYVVLEEDDVVLTPGDSLTIPAGQSRWAWNAGDETARLVLADEIALAAAA
jgi:quercetin dioxygenase-like cupin family protein